MPKPLVQLTVFISCPSDLDAERHVIESAITEVNPWLRDSHGVVLHTIGWDVDLVPGLGSDVQSVINSQIEGRYDIYIGLLNTRFGTPRPRAESGTEEEFNNAYERYGRSPESVRVLFYFKTVTGNVHRVDLEQLAKVVEFRKKVSGTALHHDFEDKDALFRMVKDHPRRLITEQWDGDKWRVLTRLPDPSTPLASIESLIGISSGDVAPISSGDDDDETEERASAILDAIVSGEEAFHLAQQSLENLAGLGTTLTTKLQSHTAAFPPQPTARQTKTVVDAAAEDLGEYNTGLQRELSVLKSSLGQGLAELETAIALYFSEQLGPRDALGMSPQHVQELIAGMRSGRTAIDEFRDVITNLPGMTIKLKKSKRKAKELLAELSAAITVFLSKAEAIEKQTSE